MPVMTPKFRVSWPNVFTPKLNNLSNKEEYSVTALFAKNADLTALKVAAQKAMEKKWGKEQSKWPKNIRSPFRLQEERMKDGVLPPGHEEGAVFINLKSKDRPQIVDAQVQDIIDTSAFYAGCYARATVNAYAYGGPGTGISAGVAFGLGNIQKLADGEPLGGGRTKAEDDFEAIEGTEIGNAQAGGIFS